MVLGHAYANGLDVVYRNGLFPTVVVAAAVPSCAGLKMPQITGV